MKKEYEKKKAIYQEQEKEKKKAFNH